MRIFEELAEFLVENKVFYFHMEPEILDFTKKFEGNLCFDSGKKVIKFGMPEKREFNFMVGFLFANVFSKSNTILTWNIKSLISYILFRLGRKHKINNEARIIDIQVGERFIGKVDKKPINFSEVKKRAIPILDKEVFSLHNKIHIPLAIGVVSRMEVSGFIDDRTKKKRYCWYEIEGQKHGRMNCHCPSNVYLSPHSMGSDEKEHLHAGLDDIFAVFDFKGMEVCVLAKFSQDKKLLKIVDSGRDIYRTINQLCFQASLQDKIIKHSFLSVLFGVSPEVLSNDLNIETNIAKEMIHSYKNHFKTAFDFLDEKQKEASKGVLSDFFGRRREYQDKFHIAKNAVIQGPAATLCQEKLINLDGLGVEIAASIHDAFILKIPERELRDTVTDCVFKLEEKSELCQDLKLRVGVETGKSLNNLENYAI